MGMSMYVSKYDAYRYVYDGGGGRPFPPPPPLPFSRGSDFSGCFTFGSKGLLGGGGLQSRSSRQPLTRGGGSEPPQVQEGTPPSHPVHPPDIETDTHLSLQCPRSTKTNFFLLALSIVFFGIFGCFFFPFTHKVRTMAFFFWPNLEGKVFSVTRTAPLCKRGVPLSWTGERSSPHPTFPYVEPPPSSQEPNSPVPNFASNLDSTINPTKLGRGINS